MIIADAMIIKYLVEFLKSMNNDKSLKLDESRFVSNGLIIFKEELAQFEDIQMEIFQDDISERVRIKFIGDK